MWCWVEQLTVELQGNSLLKDGQFPSAAERYIKSLTHIQKMFDLNPEQTKVGAVVADAAPRPQRILLFVARAQSHLAACALTGVASRPARNSLCPATSTSLCAS
jgi:hypothetical protein